MGRMTPFVALALLAASACGGRPTGEDPATIDLSAPPEQSETAAESISVSSGGYDFTITKKARYRARGIVLSTASYWSGWQTELSPLDLAIGWGDLISSGAYRDVSWSQSNRWYWFRYGPGFGRDNAYIGTQSANTHIIPANTNLERAVKSVDVDDRVELEGFLVDVDGKKGGNTVWWRSSMSRDDTGDASCEVLYLTRLKVDGKIYE